MTIEQQKLSSTVVHTQAMVTPKFQSIKQRLGQQQPQPQDHTSSGQKRKVTLTFAAKIIFKRMVKGLKSVTVQHGKKNRVGCQWCFGLEDSKHVAMIIDQYYKALCLKEVSFLERKTRPEMIICKVIRKLMTNNNNNTTVDKVCVYRYDDNQKQIKFAYYEYCTTVWTDDGLPLKISINTDKSLFEAVNTTPVYLFASPVSTSRARQFVYSASQLDRKLQYADIMVSDILRVAPGSSGKLVTVPCPTKSSQKHKMKKLQRTKELEEFLMDSAVVDS